MMTSLPIRLRLTLWYLAVTTLTAVVAFASVYLGMHHVIHRTIDSQLSERTEEVRSFLWQHHELKRRHSIDTWADAFSRSSGVEPGQELYQLKDETGAWVYQSPAMQRLDIPAALPDLQSKPQYVNTKRHRGEVRFLTTSMEVAGKEYLVQVATNVTPFYSVLQIFRIAALLALSALILFAGAGGYWLSGRAMRPVHDITAGARAVSEHNLKERLPLPAAKDELSNLVIVLNSMLARLEAAFQRVSQFTADASHELRTPITVIRSTAEVMLDRRREPAEYEEYGNLILREAEFTSGLIEDLLALARTDSAPVELNLSSVQASSLAKDAWEAIRPVAERQGLRLLAQGFENASLISVDRISWKRLLLILLDNACKYTPAGGEVELTLASSETVTTFTVRDTGIGIPPQEIDAVFKRFYRAGNTRGLDINGSGLGLSLARWIAEAHHAKLNVSSTEGAGTTIQLSLSAGT